MKLLNKLQFYKTKKVVIDTKVWKPVSLYKENWNSWNTLLCVITLLALQSCWRSTWTEPLLGLIPLYKQYPPAHFLTPHRSLAQSSHKQEHLKLPQYLLSTVESKQEFLDKIIPSEYNQIIFWCGLSFILIV